MNEKLLNNIKELQEYIEQVYSRLKEYASNLGVYKHLDVCFVETPPLNYEDVYCFVDKRGYHYCSTERGQLLLHNTTHSLFEKTYWVIRPEIFAMASRYEYEHRVAEQDIRRLLFKTELALFDKLGGNYKKQAEIQIDELLREAPYVAPRAQE